jgi:sulfate adenylyltransferase subunit 2
MPHLFTCGSVDDGKSTLLGRAIGKDSWAKLQLAREAFSPGRLPMPVLHIVHTNPDSIARNINPFDHGSKAHTGVMKTQALR